MQGGVMDGTVNVKSRTEYYDSDKILSKWGFTDSQCHHCGILNSDLNGLLMQCATCKKAYYCSMKCFNEALPAHQKFCKTKEITSEPKGLISAPFEFDDDDMKPKKNAKNKLKADLPPAPRKEEAKEKRKRPKKKEKVDVVVTEEVEITEEVEVTEVVEMTEVLSMEEKVEEALDVAVEESISHYDEEADEVVELQNSVYSLDLSASEQVYTTISMSQSFSEFGYFIPRRDEFKREEVDLRHAEMMKREYGWMTPSWVDAQLRSTPKGRVLKNKGDIVSPITNAKVLIEQGVISWEAPVWANAKLRKTPRGEAIKRAAMLSEEQRSILSGVAAEKEQETKN